ncbi:MAG: DUF4397 domain-containing protein [Cyclobacteriaceae bacterium]
MRFLDYMKKQKFSHMLSMVSILGLLVLTSCLDNEKDPVPIVTDISYVSIYHGSPDTDGLDIIVGNTGQINALPFEYEDYSNYLNFYSGDRNLTFTDANNEVALVLDTLLNFETGETYSLFIADSLKSIEMIKVKDSFPSVADGEAMVRFAHLSPDATTIDAYVDNEKILSDKSFKEVSEFLPVSSGRETFEIRAAGTDEVLLTIPVIELLDEEYYTLVVNGFVNPPSGNDHGLGSDIIRL